MSYVSPAILLQRRVTADPGPGPGPGDAPDTFAGLTAWLDFTDPSRLRANTGGTTPITGRHQVVRRVNDRAGGIHWVYPSGNDVLWAPGIAGARGGLIFRGPTNTSWIPPVLAPANDAYLDTYLGLAEKTVLVVGRIRAERPSGSEEFFFRETWGYFGMRVSAARIMVEDWQASDYRRAIVTADTSQFTAFAALHGGGQLRARVNMGGFAQVAKSPSDYLGPPQLGLPSGNLMDLELLHLVMYDRQLTASEIDDLTAWAMSQGGAPDYTEVLPTGFTQSSAYDPSLVATTTNMRDGDPTTGCGAGTGSGTAWLRADLGEPRTICRIDVDGGYLPAWGGVSGYINGATLQRSDNGTSWTTVMTSAAVNGVQDPSLHGGKRLYFAPAAARYWRFTNPGWLATTKFQLYE